MLPAMYELIGEGRHRRVYRHGDYVIKVPLNEAGVADNYHERGVWLKHGPKGDLDGVQYARCRLLGAILVMQYACFVGPHATASGYIHQENRPRWADWVDCGQVGYNRLGRSSHTTTDLHENINDLAHCDYLHGMRGQPCKGCRQ